MTMFPCFTDVIPSLHLGHFFDDSMGRADLVVFDFSMLKEVRFFNSSIFIKLFIVTPYFNQYYTSME